MKWIAKKNLLMMSALLVLVGCSSEPENRVLGEGETSQGQEKKQETCADIESAIEASQSPDSNVRREAVSELLRQINCEGASAALQRLTNDQSTEVRLAVMDGVASHESSEAMASQIVLFSQDKNRDVQLASLVASRQLADTEYASSMEDLALRFSTDSDVSFRLEAARSFSLSSSSKRVRAAVLRTVRSSLTRNIALGEEETEAEILQLGIHYLGSMDPNSAALQELLSDTALLSYDDTAVAIEVARAYGKMDPHHRRFDGSWVQKQLKELAGNRTVDQAQVGTAIQLAVGELQRKSATPPSVEE